MKKLFVLQLMGLCVFASSAFGEMRVKEKILGVERVADGIVFQVTRGARKDGLTIEKVTRTEEVGNRYYDVIHITLVRLVFDTTLVYLPLGEKVKYTFEELGLKQGMLYTIDNQMGFSSF